jgi:NAD(P)H-dependent FMN reductase
MLRLLVFYGSYRSDRTGIRLADYAVRRFRELGVDAELVDARAVGLPILDRMFSEYAPGSAPPAMEALAGKITAADAFLFVAGGSNWGMQAGLKNLVDHFQDEWSWRPAAIATYSSGRYAGVRAGCAWHATLAQLGMAVVPSCLAVGPITSALDEESNPLGEPGEALDHNFGRFADDIVWWATAAKEQRSRMPPPY